MIHTSRWKKLRLSKLIDQPLCEECMKSGKTTCACEVHHIIPVESSKNASMMESLMFNYSNLMSLCHTCHSRIHSGMFSHTKENVASNNKRKVDRFKDRYL